MDDGAIGIELGSGMTGVVGKLFNQVLVGITQFIFWHIRDRQNLGREMFDKVL